MSLKNVILLICKWCMRDKPMPEKEKSSPLPRTGNIICILLIFIGFYFRLSYYFQNQSLWVDEAYVAVEISAKSYRDIFCFLTILSGQPQTPILFQLICKFFTSLFGNHELSLRLLPYLSSLAALFLFYQRKVTQSCKYCK